MKILVICQYYFPEPFRITDICEELVKNGHEVTVVTGIPNYPMGFIYNGYKHGEKRDEIINGVKIHRCFTIGRKTGIIHRFLNYYSYARSSTAYAARLSEEFDVVFVNQLSPVIMANAGIKYKKKFGKKLVLYCLDLWPESLAAGNISRNSFIYKHFYKVSKRIYRQADQILITSKSFAEYLCKEFDIVKDKITYLPQYAEAVFSVEACKKQPNGMIDLMFAGNIGKAQSVETIIRAANETKDIKNLRWHIVGDGSELENCKRLSEKLGVTSITFHGRKPVEDMPGYYAMADAMLVTMQDDAVLSMTLPGKVQTYMAAGKPILGAINGETARIIEESKCGLCCEANNYEQLARYVICFCQLKDFKKYEDNANNYYDNCFNKNSFIKKLECKLK